MDERPPRPIRNVEMLRLKIVPDEEATGSVGGGGSGGGRGCNESPSFVPV